MSSIFFHLPCPAASWDTSLSERHEKPYSLPTGSGSSLLVSGSRDLDASKTSMNTSFFFNGSWEMIPGQKTPAAEGSHARFLYGRWELGNGKWEMAHRPVTMDHRKV